MYQANFCKLKVIFDCFRPRLCGIGAIFVWLLIGNLIIIFIYIQMPKNIHNKSMNKLKYRKKYITLSIENSNEKCGDLEIMKPNTDNIAIFGFAEHCCRFDDPERLLNSHSTILKITGSLLQSYKYLKLNKAKDRVRKLFEFNKSIIERSNNYSEKLFKNDTFSYKLCVHIKREDFIELGQSSSLYLTQKSIEYIYKSLKKRSKNISIVLIGQDSNFLNLVDSIEGLPIYKTLIRNRGLLINFAISKCNSLLITASTSIQAWWIAFLMPEGSPIYYNNCQGIDCDKILKKDYFPPEWLPLIMDIKGNIILDDNPYK